jgi:hypothetical protein
MPRTATTAARCASDTPCKCPVHATHYTPPGCAQPTHHIHTKKNSHTRTQHHTHVRAVRLPSTEGMVPTSWLLSNLTALQDTRTAIPIVSQHGTPHHRRPQPAVHSAPLLIAWHRYHRALTSHTRNIAHSNAAHICKHKSRATAGRPAQRQPQRSAAEYAPHSTNPHHTAPTEQHTHSHATSAPHSHQSRQAA